MQCEVNISDATLVAYQAICSFIQMDLAMNILFAPQNCASGYSKTTHPYRKITWENTGGKSARLQNFLAEPLRKIHSVPSINKQSIHRTFTLYTPIL
jgi:hypothetical protein